MHSTNAGPLLAFRLTRGIASEFKKSNKKMRNTKTTNIYKHTYIHIFLFSLRCYLSFSIKLIENRSSSPGGKLRIQDCSFSTSAPLIARVFSSLCRARKSEQEREREKRGKKKHSTQGNLWMSNQHFKDALLPNSSLFPSPPLNARARDRYGNRPTRWNDNDIIGTCLISNKVSGKS